MFTSNNGKRTLGEAIDQYLSQVLPEKKDLARQTIQLNCWKTQLRVHRICDISLATISESRVKLQRGFTHYGAPRSPATVNRYPVAISHVYTVVWKEWNWINSNSVLNIKKLKEPRGRVRCLDDQERQVLLDNCKESKNYFLFPIVVLALSIGMRKGEILGLRWRDVDIHNKRIVIQW